VTKMETDALAADEGAAAAKNKLAAASAALVELRQKFQDSIKNDPDWQAAKQQLDEALAAIAEKPAPAGMVTKASY